MAAGLVFKTKFIASSSGKPFSGYINYIDRPEAASKVKEYDVFGTYNEYMGNPEKSNGLFTAEKDRISKDEKDEIKNIFCESQKKGGLLMQCIFSFEDDWLKKTNLMLQEGQVNEELIRKYTRAAVKTLMKSEGMESWNFTAAIHHNTQHVHVHVALVDPAPAWKEGVGRCRRNQNGQLYQRGKLNLKTLQQTKSTFINLAIDAEKQNEKINQLARALFVRSAKLKEFHKADNREMRKLFFQLMESLPEDRTQWFYGKMAMEPYRKDIDQLTTLFLTTDFKEEYREFQKLVTDLSEQYAVSYGTSNRNFSEQKTQDLYYRIGNAILSECRDLAQDRVRLRERQEYFLRDNRKRLLYIKWEKRAYFAIRKALQTDIDSLKNQAAYEKLMKEEQLKE